MCAEFLPHPKPLILNHVKTVKAIPSPGEVVSDSEVDSGPSAGRWRCIYCLGVSKSALGVGGLPERARI